MEESVNESKNLKDRETSVDNQGVVYNISSKQESLGRFESVDSSSLQDLKERLKATEDKCYNLNRDIGSLSAKMEFWDKWKWLIITAATSPLLVTIGTSILNFIKITK